MIFVIKGILFILANIPVYYGSVKIDSLWLALTSYLASVTISEFSKFSSYSSVLTYSPFLMVMKIGRK